MKKNINKIGFTYVLFFLIAFTAIGQIVYLQFFAELDEGFKGKTQRSTVVPPTRGSILACDGRYLAFSTPEYIIGMGTPVPNDTLFDNHIGELAEALASTFKEHPAKYYRDTLSAHRARGKQYTRLLKQTVDYETMKQIASFPILNKGRAYGGFIAEKIEHREYPYSDMAFRTLGYVRNNTRKIGVEGKMDSVLRGVPGTHFERKTEHNIWIDDVTKEDIPPINGMDVQTSIDITIQEIAHRALLHKIEGEADLQAGCVIVMDVKSGEIRAMVNMEKDDKGKFSERMNYAIGRLGEPGSVFKLATLVTALEDKKVKLETVQPGDVFWHYYKVKKPFEDTYLRNYSSITVAKGFEISSNNVFRRIAGEKYGHNPQEFIDKIRNDRKILYNYEFDLYGMGKATCRNTDDRYWSEADLPQIAMGYAVQVTPLHILQFYNAVANDGIMVKPHLYVNLQRDGQVQHVYPVDTIGRVCSYETAQLAKQAMRGVVAGSNGTGRVAFANCPVKVAGKTGTARIALPHGGYVNAAGQKQHQGSFVGFFPYENPKYSLIVVVYSRLAAKNFYGGSWGGPVAREIVDNIYATSPEWFDAIPAEKTLPPVAEALARIIESNSDSLQIVPDVAGLGLRDAIHELEALGFEVKSTGRGKVSSQKPEAGTAIAADKDKKEITIYLSEHVDKNRRSN